MSGEHGGLNLGSSVLTADQVICGDLAGEVVGAQDCCRCPPLLSPSIQVVAEDARVAVRRKRELWLPLKMFYLMVYWDLAA